MVGNNIYDMARNVFEWTMSSANNFSRDYRSGNFFSLGTEMSASSVVCICLYIK